MNLTSIIWYGAILILSISSIRGLIISIKTFITAKHEIKQRKYFEPTNSVHLEGKLARIYGAFSALDEMLFLVSYSVLAFPNFYGGLDLFYVFFVLGLALVPINVFIARRVRKEIMQASDVQTTNNNQPTT